MTENPDLLKFYQRQKAADQKMRDVSAWATWFMFILSLAAIGLLVYLFER